MWTNFAIGTGEVFPIKLPEGRRTLSREPDIALII